jgi:hypothetical protein
MSTLYIFYIYIYWCILHSKNKGKNEGILSILREAIFFHYLADITL